MTYSENYKSYSCRHSDSCSAGSIT